MSSSRDYIIIRAPAMNTEGKQPSPYPRSHFLPRRQRKINEPLGFLGFDVLSFFETETVVLLAVATT